MSGSSVEVARLPQVAVLVVLFIATASCFQAVRGHDDGGGLRAGNELEAGDEGQRLPVGDNASEYLHRRARKACSKCNSKNQTCCSYRYCVNLKTNAHHCGSCGHQCGNNNACCNGHCVNLRTSRSNCGKCGITCHSSSTCEYGLCGY